VITLTNSANRIVGVRVTPGNGVYFFGLLAADTYTVTAGLPTGYISATQTIVVVRAVEQRLYPVGFGARQADSPCPPTPTPGVWGKIGRIGQLVAEEFRREKSPFVAVDSNPDSIARCRALTFSSREWGRLILPATIAQWQKPTSRT